MQYVEFIKQLEDSFKTNNPDSKIKKKEIKEIIELALNAIVDIISQKDSLSFNNFGKFFVTETKEKKGRNPKTGEPITIPARTRAKFNFSNAVKKMAIN